MRYVCLFARFAPAVLLILGISIPAQAQVETEPNSSCPAAQDLGALNESLTLTGSLDTPPATPDVDFYRIAARRARNGRNLPWCVGEGFSPSRAGASPAPTFFVPPCSIPRDGLSQ